MIPTLFIVSVLVFLFVHMLPGDPARLIAGPEADAQVIELVRQQLGLDQPLYHQFWHYISNAVQGDFGLSMVSRRPVADGSYANAVADHNQYGLGGDIWYGGGNYRRRLA